MAATKKNDGRVRQDFSGGFAESLSATLDRTSKASVSQNEQTTKNAEASKTDVKTQSTHFLQDDLKTPSQTPLTQERTYDTRAQVSTQLNNPINMFDDDDDDAIFSSLIKGGRGVQRSIYLESDIYRYIQSKADKYGVKFSNVVNLLLKEAIYKKK